MNSEKLEMNPNHIGQCVFCKKVQNYMYKMDLKLHESLFFCTSCKKSKFYCGRCNEKKELLLPYVFIKSTNFWLDTKHNYINCKQHFNEKDDSDIPSNDEETKIGYEITKIYELVSMF